MTLPLETDEISGDDGFPVSPVLRHANPPAQMIPQGQQLPVEA